MIRLAKDIGSHSTQRRKKTENQFQCSASLILNQNKGSELWFEIRPAWARSFLPHLQKGMNNGACVSWMETEGVCVGFSSVPAALQCPTNVRLWPLERKIKGAWGIVILGKLVYKWLPFQGPRVEVSDRVLPRPAWGPSLAPKLSWLLGNLVIPERDLQDSMYSWCCPNLLEMVLAEVWGGGLSLRKNLYLLVLRRPEELESLHIPELRKWKGC